MCNREKLTTDVQRVLHVKKEDARSLVETVVLAFVEGAVPPVKSTEKSGTIKAEGTTSKEKKK